ncbi:MAG: hypothetical protein IPK27_11320 [Rhodanobacteraceae bacterium]|nr:hypothetical protein [Rhodanobacteraceae bacterium]
MRGMRQVWTWVCGLAMAVAAQAGDLREAVPPGHADAAMEGSRVAQRALRPARTKLFGAPRGCNGFVYAMVTAPSGLVYLGGDFSACEDVLASNVAAYDPRTRQFLALGSGTANGVSAGAFGGVYALALQGSDLIVGGSFTAAGGAPADSIARWNGSAWSTLGNGEVQGVAGLVYDLAVNGADLYAGGLFSSAGGVPAASIARWDGSAWTALGGGVGGRDDASVYALQWTDGALFVGGLFTQAGGAPASNIARWSGSAWSALGAGTDGPVNTLAAFGNEIYAGGQFANAGGQAANALARWNGTAWRVVGTAAAHGVSGGVLQLLVSGSELYVAGFFVQAGDQPANNTARWNGSVWASLGSGDANGTSRTVWALAQGSDGLYVGGEFDAAGGQPASFIASFDGSGWRAPGSGVGNGVNNTVDALAISGNDLYVGGAFTQAAGAPANHVARWNGSVWNSLGSGTANGTDARVLALAVQGSELYAGGYFGNAGGEPAALIARWNGSAWSTLGSGVAGRFPSVLAIEPVGSDLYVGGEFTVAGGQPANKIARWNGSSWSALGSGAANGVSDTDFIPITAIKALGSDLIVAGDFTTAGGQPANRVARWNGSAWSALGSGMNNIVYALAVIGSDVYAGGGFSEAGGQPIQGVARWNGSAWQPLGTLELNGVNGTVRALAVSGSELYVGGSFTTAGGQPANGLARWDGSAWHGLAVDAPPQVVRAMVVDRGSLYAGGAGLSQTPLPDLQSRSLAGSAADGASSEPVTSRSGGSLAFASLASNLVAGDGNGRSDIFLRDPASGATLRASALAEAINGGAAESFSEPALSADGARLAYRGSSGQLYANIGGSARVLSRSAAGVPGNGASGRPMLPGNGALAFFESQASNLLATADGNGAVADIFVTDLATGAVTLVSRGPAGEPADGPSSAPWASQDGQTIAFSTLASNIVPGSAAQPGLKAGTVQQATIMRGGGFGQSRFYVSRNLATGELGNGHSTNVRVTPDGKYGVFESLASNLVPGDSNNAADVFRFEISGNQLVRLERVSTSRYGEQANAASRNPTICDDGQFVGFETDASNLVELDRNGTSDILVKWLVTGEVVRLSRTADGNQPNGASGGASISGDCSSIAFASAASNLAPGDGNGAPDVFSVALRERAPTLVSGPQDEPALTGFALPAPDPANASCPAGFFIAAVDDGPGQGLTPGIFGVELLLDAPGTRVLAGGLNFGGLIDAGQVGFAGFNFPNAATEPQRLNLRVTGSPADDSAGSLQVLIRIARRTASSSETVLEQTAQISLASAFQREIDLPPGFYEATVGATSGSPGGAPEGQFFFALSTSFVDRPGGGFQGGAVVGGYHATHPFGGVSGFAAFCIATPHATSIRVLSRPSYGPAGAQDLRLKLRDAQQRELVVVPAG